MGTIQWMARPMATFPVDGVSISTCIDVLDSTHISMAVDAMVLPSDGTELAVEGFHSIDGQTWEALTGLSLLVSAEGAYTATAATPAFRYLRLRYELFAAAAAITFGVRVFVKTRGRGLEMTK